MPQASPSPTVFEVELGTPAFGQVMALWRAHSNTLGFLPVGGFEDAARNRTLIAIGDGQTIQGYLLYRRSYDQLAITHLCTSPSYVRQGAARRLTSELSRRHPEAKGIGLWCRRDFPANDAWQHLGFSAKAYRLGRGKGRETLVFWFKDHGHEDLFSYALPAQVEATVDSCVLFDILDEDDALEKEESRSLLSDWLQDIVRLMITPEVGNDIQRDHDEIRRSRRNSGKTIFEELRIPPEKFNEAEQSLLKVLPLASDEQTRSDYRHLAWTKAARIKYFVTRDGPLLRARDVLREMEFECFLPENSSDISTS